MEETRYRITLRDWCWRISASLLVWFTADVLAAVIFYWNPPLIGYTEKGNLILELFSFTHTLSLLAVGCIWYPLCRRNPVLRFPFAAFLLLAAFYLMLFQYFRPTYDFRCWMNGMESHL
jgi:hypothetical protein